MTTQDNVSRHFALCPLDGRYGQISEKLAPYFPEYALVKNRVKVEVLWLQFLLENVNGSDILDNFDMNRISEIMSIYTDFSDDSYLRIKEIESRIDHDVKAVELFVDEKLKEFGLDSLVSFVHIGCTSEDITNCSYARMISDTLSEVWIPAAEQLIDAISKIASNYADTAMLAHTHGQPATPTTVGKEMAVYAYRLWESVENIESIEPYAKWNGATGNYAAISVAFPNEDWPMLAMCFVEDYLNLTFNPVTTQIESHDWICRVLNEICLFSNILEDFVTDIWEYISREYFKQIPVENEVGSSTMPHKINPIKFENAEANLEMAKGLCITLSNKLPRSRLQRDLSDSSLQRNLGMCFGYSIQAIEQTISGLKKVEVNKDKLERELDEHWELLAEPIQTMLRKYGIPDAYDGLKELTRGKSVSKELIHEFINSLDIISDEDRANLLALTPSKYIGLASKIARTV